MEGNKGFLAAWLSVGNSSSDSNRLLNGADSEGQPRELWPRALLVRQRKEGVSVVHACPFGSVIWATWLPPASPVPQGHC